MDATSTIEDLGKEGWWGPLTTAATLTIRGRDGRGNECGGCRWWHSLRSVGPKCLTPVLKVAVTSEAGDG